MQLDFGKLTILSYQAYFINCIMQAYTHPYTVPLAGLVNLSAYGPELDLNASRYDIS